MKLQRKRLSLIPEERNTHERLEARAIYANEVSNISYDNLVFLDETGFNEHTRRLYGYAPVNQKAYITVPANRNVNKSLICAISVTGIVGHEIKTGSYNSEVFIKFLTTLIVPYFRRNPTKVLIMDNARFHKSKAVLGVLQENRIVYKFLTPYSPELNPIEEFFSMIKSRFHSKKHENPTSSIEEILNEILSPENDYSNQCNGFYRNMTRWLEKARQMEPFIFNHK